MSDYNPKLAKRVMLLHMMVHLAEIRRELVTARHQNVLYTGNLPPDRVFARLKPFIDRLDDALAEQYQLVVGEG